MPESGLAVLSAGALRVGVLHCVDSFSRRSGVAVDVRFATSPDLRAEVEGGTFAPAVIIAPLPLHDAFAAAGRTVAGSRVRVGSIRAGIVVHRDAPALDIATRDDLVRALRRARRIVFNLASSGQAIARMLDDFGLAGELAARIERPPNGAAVMETVAAHPEIDTLGFGQGTEIRRLEHLGIRLAGYLPAELDTITTYDAALGASVATTPPARDFLAFLAGDEARALLRRTGID